MRILLLSTLLVRSYQAIGKSILRRKVRNDRVSENGQCDLFVYEQLVSGSDTRLLGFYAVNKTTNEVFSADNDHR